MTPKRYGARRKELQGEHCSLIFGRTGAGVNVLLLALLALPCSGVSAQRGLATLEEVIVTAQKRESTLQDAPLAVSAFTGENLALLQINNAMDLQMSVPNMLMTQGNFASPNIIIRGIGNNAVSNASDSGTGVHFNGMYLKASSIFESEFYDTERIEVLRGPQGTLYGRNTTAGVINIISKKPVHTLGGDIQLQAGNYNSLKAKGAINFPITDNLWQRFSGIYQRRDGYVDNNYNGDDIDGRNMGSLRSSTRWLMGDATDATLVITYFKEDSDRMLASGSRCTKDADGILGCLPGALGREVTHSAATSNGLLTRAAGLVLGLPFPNDDYANSRNPSDLREAMLEINPEYAIDETIVVLEINHALEKYNFTALGGYHNSKTDIFVDADNTVASEAWPLTVTADTDDNGSFTDNRLFAMQDTDNDSDQWSAEARLASAFGGKSEFLLGAFWLNYELEHTYTVYSSSFELAGDTLGIPEAQRRFEVHEQPFTLDSWALFGEFYYHLTDNTELTFGLRYTQEEKTKRSRTVFLTFLDDPNAADGGYADFKGDWNETTGKFNITHYFANDMLLYGTLARSYKSGGFNPISSESPLLEFDPSLVYFDPEYINSFEVGVKSRLFHETLQANLSYFFYDYDGMQVSRFVEGVSLNENVDSIIQGIEAEFLYVPDIHWQLGLNLAWLDTKIKDFSTVDPANPNQMGTTEGIVSGPTGANTMPALCGIGCPGIPADLDGNEIPNAPNYSANLMLAYNWFFNNGLSLRLGTTYYWQDQFYTRIFNATQDEVESWSVWNANAIVNSAKDRWWLEAWVRNITDDDNITGQYLADAVAGLGTNYFLLDPRTFGLTLGYRF